MTNWEQYTNKVKISYKKPAAYYFESILIRMQPDIYKRYGNIKVSFSKNAKKTVFYLINVFWHCGLVLKEINPIPEIEVGGGAIIKDCYEAILKKVPAIEFEDNEEYRDWIEEKWKVII